MKPGMRGDASETDEDSGSGSGSEESGSGDSQSGETGDSGNTGTDEGTDGEEDGNTQENAGETDDAADGEDEDTQDDGSESRDADGGFDSEDTDDESGTGEGDESGSEDADGEDADSEETVYGISLASDGDDDSGTTGDGTTNAYDGTALKAYADELMEKYGLTVTISQSPAGGNTVESGDAVTWHVTISIPTAENYSGFSFYNKTLYDSYDDLTIYLTAPDGITITSVSASGYDSEIQTDSEGTTTAVVSFGDVTASAQTISFTVTGYVDADPAPATGTTYTLSVDDVTYSTNITVLDRDNSNAEVETYTVTGNTSTDLSGFVLTSMTDDEWALTKTQNSYSAENGVLTVVYTIELIMNEFTQDSQYTANGRVNFDSFSIVDTPTITGEDGSVYTPSSITVVNTTTNETVATMTGSSDTSVAITDYATLDDSGLTETTSSNVAIEGTVPFYTTYTVTVTYDASQFTSQFYDAETYTMYNEAVLDYTLEYVEGTDPETGTDTKTVDGTYSYAADPATIDLEKYIRSIYGGGNYLTETSLDSDYTGDVEFTILDEDGNAAELYILYDYDGDGTAEYVQISNVITITRDSSGNAYFYVTMSSDSSSDSGSSSDDSGSSDGGSSSSGSNGLLATISEAFSSAVSAVSNLLLGSSSDTITYTGLLYLNAGTYSIEETKNMVKYTSFTEFTSNSGTTLTADEDNEKYSFTLTAGQAATINAYNTETRGSVHFNKSVTNYDGSSATGDLAGAVFGIYTDADCKEAVTDSSGAAMTATSDSQGIVTFTKLEPGPYYIKEITALDGCLLDTKVYTVTVTANETTTTFSDNNGTVYNKKNAASLTFEKYLLSTDSSGNLVQVAVDSTRLENVFNKDSSESQVFVLQYYDSDTDTWVTLDRTITLQRDTDSNNVSISSAELSGLPVYTDSTATTAYQYRLVEYLPEGYSLASISGVTDGDIKAEEDSSAGTVTTESFTLVDGDTTVSLTNQTTGEISVYKQYVQANADGVITGSANDSTAVTVYLLTKNADDSYSYVTTATNNGTTTGSNGYAAVTGVNILGDSDNTAQEYYWAEATSSKAYSSYVLQGGETINVDVDGVETEMYLLGTAAYASAYESTSTKTTLTNILPYVRVKLTKESSTTGAYVSGAGYTVYRVETDGEGNETEVEYSTTKYSLAANTSGTVASGGSTLVLEAGYVYHIYETTVPDNYTGLTNADDSSSIGDYVTVDLTKAVPDDSTDNGVKQGTYAAEATFKDEPYPTFKLTKNLVSVNGSSVSTSTSSATFTVYRCDTENGTYTLYDDMSSYTANTTVYLEPGYYYAFVENVTSDVVSPEVYPGVDTTNSNLSGGSLTQITIDDGTVGGTTAYAFVTSDKLISTGTTTSYSIGTVTNYENTSSIKVTKYAYTSGTSSTVTLDGAVIGLYSDSSCKDEYLITSGTTSGGTVTFTDLAVYTDSSGTTQKTYYIKEISAPDGYFVDDTVYTVTLTPGKVSTVSVYDEQELSVSVPVIWEDCLNKAQDELAGATVYAYEVIKDDSGNIISYELAGSAVSGSDGYATITGLKHNTEYVFILGASGVTDTTAENYPLYASEDGKEDYLITTTVTTDDDGKTTVTYSEAPTTLTSLDGYQTISYAGCTDLSEDSFTITTSLVNHLLYLQVMIQKYCEKNHGDDRRVGLYNSDGTMTDAETSGAYFVNGAQFTLYRQALTEEEVEALANGETITITYDASKLEKVTDDTSTDTGKADVDDTYNTAYVYWLAETATGTAHTWAYAQDENGDYIYNSDGEQQYESYYRVLLYSSELSGTIEVENATDAQKFTANKTVYLNVENTCGSGTHEYLLSTIYMNKWADYYDEFGVDTKGYSPLSGVTFSFSLKNSAGTTVALSSNMTKGDIAVQYGETDTDGNTQSDNDAGQMSVMFKFPLLLNEWIVAVANASGMNVTTITDITSNSTKLATFNAITGDTWDTYADMLYVASVINASSTSQLTDLAANDGAVAKRILTAYAATYSTTKISVDESGNVTENGDKDYITAMENVLGSYYTWEEDGNTQSLGYKSYYAHIVLTETDTTKSSEYGDYELNTTDYALYLQFRPTGSEGSANIKYFYLDDVDRTDYYYNADPSGVSTKVLDESFDNTTREQIVNMPVLKKSVSITKYGYTLNSSTTGKTDDELDGYFDGTDGSGRKKITASFYLQRYDSTSRSWKYYDITDGEYVDEADKNDSIINVTTDGWSGKLAIGWYRLIEISAGSGYDAVLDGTSVDIAGSSDTTEAVRYFWVKTESDSSAVNVYDPDSIDLLIHKYSLSGTEIKSGVTITLTDSDGNKYTATSWDSTAKAYVITNLSVGTYTVTESVTNTSVTDAYFQSFTITVGYDREAKAETVDLTYSKTKSVTQYATYITGVSASISGQVNCANDSTEDSIKANTIDASGATATLKIYNPSTGSITITKADANDSSSTLSGATFKLYYQKFAVDSSDAYVADTSSTPTYTSGSSDWTYIGEYTTTGSGGTITASGLTPGWYAVVETGAPDGYELNSEVQAVPVVADMAVDQSGAHTKTDNGKVSATVEDVKKVNLSVTKIFNLNDFTSDLQDEAWYYSVTFGLYVYDTTSGTYISAKSLGLTDTDTVTVTVNNTSGTITTDTGTWYNLIQMEEYLDSNGHYVLGTYTLDGSYYIREISVKNTNTSVDITDDLRVSGVSMSSGSDLTVDETAVTDSSGYSYYELSGFKDNATGTVTVTNDLTYATVTILKTNDASPAEPLSGATFTVYSDADCTTAVAYGTTGTNGTCTITVPVSSTTGTTFYIKETTAPTGYTLYEDTITVTLMSGQKVSYSQDGNGYLEIADSNGVYVKLTKYDNIHDYSGASPLSNVTFTLLHSEDNGASWTVLRTYTTDSGGGINFDTLKNSEGVIYMLAEADYDTDAYDGLESVWYTVTPSGGDTSAETALAESTVTATVSGTTVSYTGYQFSLQGIDSYSTYQIYAYNQPRPEVTFIKTGHDDSGSATAVPTATLQIYSVDASTYTAGQTLTSAEVTAAINATSSTLIDTITTTAASGESYSSYMTNLSAGTYLVVETVTSDDNNEYVIDKDDSNEVWYQIIVVPSDGTKTMEVNFVNVTQEYSVSIEKTGTTDLDDALLTAEDTQKLTYYLDVDVTNSGPINGLTVTDSGLVATKVYQSVGSTATDEVTGDAAATYLKGYYSITSVKIPVDATYEYDSLVFTSGDKSAFSQSKSITAKVTFTYEDGTTEEQEKELTKVTTTDGYWTVTPTYSSLKVVSFTVTWYDENLKTYTGYELGSDFAISDSGLNIVVAMEIDGQENGTTSYEAVAEIKNSAAVTYDYTKWDTTGTATASDEDDDAEALTTVPNVSAPVMTITKSVENETSTSRNTSGTAIIGDTLLYTITLTNSSSSLPMENPIILDLLPQGVVAASAADENSFIANVTIVSITDANGDDGVSVLEITNVWRTTSDGYTLLEIETSGSIEPGETVTITLEAVVDSTILNYLTSSAPLTNNVFMTSSEKGEIYNDNAIGSVFMGDTGSWAGNYTDPTSDNVMASLLSALGVTGYGYISDSVDITYEVNSSVYLLKEVQGDQDLDDSGNGDWYYGDEGGTATANIDTESADDDGYANFRLTVTNTTTGQDLTNIVLMDIVPKKDGASFNSYIDKEWSLIFDSITSVTITDSSGKTTTLDTSYYTLWYYTGSVTTSAEVTAMQTAFSDGSLTGWVKASEYTGEMSAITAFAVDFGSAVSLSTGSKLQLIYKAMVPQMSESDASGKAHLATYNDFCLYGDLVVSSTGSTASSVSMKSNYVYVLLSTEPVGVGGMFWIDADGDGVQDSEDVVNPSSYDNSTDAGGTEGSTASTYNSRTNNYSSYSVVQSLLNTASIQLLTYSGSTSAAKTAYSGSLLTSASWRFLFTDLSSANISSAYTSADAYDSSGIRWKALAGASTATWYQLQATIAGSGSIKYSLTETSSNVQSYDPTVMYSADNSSVGNALTDSSYSASGSTTTDSGTTTGSEITTGSTTATSENFFLYGTTSGNALWNLAEDIGLVIYRDLKITKKDTGSGTPKSGSTFAVYGPYAKGEAANVTSLDSEHLVGTYTTTSTDPTTLLIENLLYFQEYIIVETSADSDYDLASAAATGTNISAITDGVTLGSTTYKSAWILGIPQSDSSYASGGANYTNTDPTAYNTVTTDNMTVTNALKIQSFSFYKISGDSYSIGEGSTVYTPLGGAKFSLYSADDVDVTKTTATDGTETVIDVKVKDNVTPIATAISEDTTGLVEFTSLSLSSGTYYLIETAAPSGYVLLTDYWIVTVDTAANTITLSGGGKTYGSSTLGWYIPNYQTSDLPLTGGIGTWPFKVVGALLMISSAVLYFLRRRRRRA